MGVITSHGPYRECYSLSRKSRGTAAAIAMSAAEAVLSAERMRAALSSPAGAPALLQRGVPEGCAEVGAVEGATTLPGEGGGQAETQQPKPALPGTRQKSGNHQSRKQLTTLRGSSLPNILFDHSCDRPGCYEGFVRARRSPLQRFCSHACRRALERVQERERRWKQARDLIRRY